MGRVRCGSLRERKEGLDVFSFRVKMKSCLVEID